MTDTADDRVRILRGLDTCAVSDALDKLGLNGAILGLRPLWDCPRIVGRAVTVRLVATDGRATPSRHLGTAAVEAAGPGDVIVVDHRGRCDVAGWGGILSLAARRRAIEGVVVDGACRDVDEAREHRFPLYARAGVPRTARGRIVEAGFNEPVELCAVVVRPGDLVIADGSGVVAIPAAREAEVLAVAAGIAARERAMADAVNAGRSITEVMGGDYESMLKRED